LVGSGPGVTVSGVGVAVGCSQIHALHPKHPPIGHLKCAGGKHGVGGGVQVGPGVGPSHTHEVHPCESGGPQIRL